MLQGSQQTEREIFLEENENGKEEPTFVNVIFPISKTADKTANILKGKK